jgi:hypothetical protein
MAVPKTSNTTTGRKFSSNFITPTTSFAAALRGNSEHKNRPHLHQDSVAGLVGRETLKDEQRQERSQSGRDPNVNTLSSDDMLKASFVVQQIMAEFKNAESEQSRIMAITKIVLYLMN